MLKLENIKKDYKSGDTTVQALKNSKIKNGMHTVIIQLDLFFKVII